MSDRKTPLPYSELHKHMGSLQLSKKVIVDEPGFPETFSGGIIKYDIPYVRVYTDESFNDADVFEVYMGCVYPVDNL